MFNFLIKKMDREMLKIKIEATELPLNSFADSLKAINNQFYLFLKQKKIKNQNKISKKINKKESELIIKEIRKGSYIVELAEKVTIQDVMIASILLSGYFDFLIFNFAYILDNNLDKIKEKLNLTIEQLKDIIKTINPITININNNINFNINKSNGMIQNFQLNNIQGNTIENKCKKLLEEMNEIDNIFQDNVEMEFYKASNCELGCNGDMVIIKTITNKPKPLKYDDEDLKQKMTNKDFNPLCCIFNIDIEIEYRNTEDDINNIKNIDNIKSYKLLKLNGVINKSDL